MSFAGLQGHSIGAARFFLAIILIALCLVRVPAGLAAETAIIILSPKSGETIHDNTGKVAVVVGLGEGAVLEKGQRVHILLDGAPAVRDRARRNFVLRDVVRGEHSLQALLVDAKGNTLASSTPVTFYMWQASRLFPGRGNDRPVRPAHRSAPA